MTFLKQFISIFCFILFSSSSFAQSKLNENCEPKNFLAKLDAKVRTHKFWQDEFIINRKNAEDTEKLFIETLLKIRNFQADTRNVVLQEAINHRRQGISGQSSQKLIEVEIKNRSEDLKMNVMIVESIIPARRESINRCLEMINQKLREK